MSITQLQRTGKIIGLGVLAIIALIVLARVGFVATDPIGRGYSVSVPAETPPA